MFGIFKRKVSTKLVLMTAMDARKLALDEQKSEEVRLASVSAKLIDSSISYLINENQSRIESYCKDGREQCPFISALSNKVINSDRIIILNKVKTHFINLGYEIDRILGCLILSWGNAKLVTPLSKVLDVKN